MSTISDKWQYFIKRVEAGLGGYEPDHLIAEVIKVILKNRYEGIIVVDMQGDIAFMDSPTEKLFDLSPGEAKGRHFSHFFTDLGLLEVLKTGTPQIGQIQEIGKQKKIVTRFPIIKDGQIIGAVGKVIFHEVEAIRALSEKIQKLEARISKYQADLMAVNRASYTFDNIIGVSRSITDLKKMAGRIAAIDCTVLIVGESGTGKELFAHAIHQASGRSKNPFVRVNCASIPFDLAESELFGYEKGAFTGASKVGQKGKFEVASGGTIFLDEISAMPLNMQAKLLRVLQEKEIQPLGSRETKKVDFRLVAATNMDLDRLIQKGAFRADLYYRLSSVPIHIPPLRKRREDIPLLVNTLLAHINQKFNAQVTSIASEAITQLVSYDWPGNVRELFNILEQAVLNVYPGTEITPQNLPCMVKGTGAEQKIKEIDIGGTVADAERKIILQALEVTGGNKRRAAQLMGISRQGIYQKMRRLDMN